MMLCDGQFFPRGLWPVLHISQQVVAESFQNLRLLVLAHRQRQLLQMRVARDRWLQVKAFLSTLPLPSVIASIAVIAGKLLMNSLEIIIKAIDSFERSCHVGFRTSILPVTADVIRARRYSMSRSMTSTT